MRKALNLTVLFAALGYFVDMFDLTVFGVVRVESLKALGYLTADEITSKGLLLLNLQAFGMLAGGILWGILGDKKGRLSILFGSILLYSVANILNAFVDNIFQYGTLRFLAGIGLAGELGAAVTLVSEILDKESRGYGTTIIATLGLLGAVAAATLGQLVSWRVAYAVGGGLGLVLLLARLQLKDSALFHKTAVKQELRGSLRLLFRGSSLVRYLRCIAVGVPIYFITGILFTFAPELSRAVGLQGVTSGNALLWGTIGLTIGDLLSGLSSQWWKSRKKAIAASLVGGFVLSLVYFAAAKAGPLSFYVVCFLLGIMGGYWAVLVTMVAEQFGTNIRATAATSVPNFVRSSVILLSLGFASLKTSYGVLPAALTVSCVVFALALWSLKNLKETYGEDLDFLEGVPQAKPSTAFAVPNRKPYPAPSFVSAADHEANL